MTRYWKAPLLTAALLLGGCNIGVQTSSPRYLRFVQRDPDSHLGQFIASSGIVTSTKPVEGDSTLILVKERGTNFAVIYPHPIPDAAADVQVWFVGRISGEYDEADEEGNPVRAIRVHAIEVDTTIARHALNEEAEFTQAWHQKRLELK